MSVLVSLPLVCYVRKFFLAWVGGRKSSFHFLAVESSTLRKKYLPVIFPINKSVLGANDMVTLSELLEV